MALYLDGVKYKVMFNDGIRYDLRYFAIQRLAQPTVTVDETNTDILQVTPDENVEKYLLFVDGKATAFVDLEGNLTPIIRFELDGQGYYIEEGADWATWCSSEDNVMGYYKADNSAIALPGSAVGDSEDSIYYIAYQGQKVLFTEKIDSAVYTLISGLE